MICMYQNSQKKKLNLRENKSKDYDAILKS